MNYNANTGSRPTLGRKIKRVSDVNAMGYQPFPQQPPNFAPDARNVDPNIAYSTVPADFSAQNVRTPSMNIHNAGATSMNIHNTGAPSMNIHNAGASYMGTPQTQQPPQMGTPLFAQPVVQDIAYQYGQQLANTGTTLVKQNIDKYVPVSKLKYYFAVDTRYVASKLKLLFFPFMHTDWSLKYEQDGSPVQPRFEINAPDLYIPTMAYVTYVLVAGVVLGCLRCFASRFRRLIDVHDKTWGLSGDELIYRARVIEAGLQKKFSPEQIGIQASSALAWCLVELLLYSCILYIINIQTTLRTLDLLAFSGYKFVIIIASILCSLVAGKSGYYLTLAYVSFSLAFFLIRTLRIQVLSETPQQQTQFYAANYPTVGNKRRLYFLLFFAGVQPVLSWWLSFHLIGEGVANLTETPSL